MPSQINLSFLLLAPQSTKAKYKKPAFEEKPGDQRSTGRFRVRA
jgi:hypothetical protein